MIDAAYSITIEWIGDQPANVKIIILRIKLYLIKNAFFIGEPMVLTSDNYPDISYKINRVETKYYVYEYSQLQTKRTNKKTTECVITNARHDFKAGCHTKVSYPKDISKFKTLFGLDDVEKEINVFIENDILCLYGPKGCGKKSLLTNLEVLQDDRQFIRFNKLRFRREREYLDKIILMMENYVGKSVLCIPDLDYYTKLEIKKIFNFIDKIEEEDLPTMSILTCEDNGLLPDYNIHFVHVRVMNDNAKLKYMTHLISNTREIDASEDLMSVVKSLRGYTGADIYQFVDSVQCYHPELTVEHLREGFAKGIYRPRQLVGVTADIESLHWTDIGGYEDVKEMMRNKIEIPLATGKTLPRGILLYGPPGCSKTMFARALATECQLNIFLITPNILGSLVGESEARFRNVLNLAHASAPSIVFIDEIDLLLPARVENESSVTTRLMQELMLFIDGAETRVDDKVIVMCATNKRDNVDEALIRSGRMDLHIKIDLPDQVAREAIVRIVLHDNRFIVDHDVLDSVAWIADQFAGKSGADIDYFGRRVKRWCRKQSRENANGAVLTMDHVKYIIETLYPHN